MSKRTIVAQAGPPNKASANATISDSLYKFVTLRLGLIPQSYTTSKTVPRRVHVGLASLKCKYTQDTGWGVIDSRSRAQHEK